MSFGEDYTGTWNVLLELNIWDLPSICETNLMVKSICSNDTFWQEKYRHDFNEEPQPVTTYQQAYLSHINNLVMRIGYEFDHFEYLINGQYYSSNLEWEDEPGDEYADIEPFNIEPLGSKIIGLTFYPGDTDPMFYQEKDGKLIELTDRPQFSDQIEGIASVDVIEVPNLLSKIILEEPLTPLPLKDVDQTVFDQLRDFNWEYGDHFDEILAIRPILETTFSHISQLIEDNQVADYQISEFYDMIILTTTSGEQFSARVRYDPFTNEIRPPVE